MRLLNLCVTLCPLWLIRLLEGVAHYTRLRTSTRGGVFHRLHPHHPKETWCAFRRHRPRQTPTLEYAGFPWFAKQVGAVAVVLARTQALPPWVRPRGRSSVCF